jgi:hypothetical protein
MKPLAVFERLEMTIGLAGLPREMRGAIEFELLTHFNLPAINASEKAEELEERVRRLVLASKEQADKAGTFSIITISSTNDRVVLGSCCIEPGDSAAVQAAKRARRYKPELLNAIRSLTFGEFEKFGSKILQELGATMVRVTPHSNDQGIDFYGTLSIGELAQIDPAICQLTHNITLRFAGQAKHYPENPIGPDVVRELIGAIDLARYRVFTSGPDLFDDFELRPFHPLLTMLFTTGHFTSGALDLGEKAGMILRTGEQLAVFLADRGIGVVGDGDASHYDEASFRAWLEGPAA